MLNSTITEYIIAQVGGKAIQYGRLDWVWSDAAADLTMELDKQNSLAGILILNFAITTTNAGGVLTIIDLKLNNHQVYQIGNSGGVVSIIAPFFYFSSGNNLKFRASVACTYGFNYITVQTKK